VSTVETWSALQACAVLHPREASRRDAREVKGSYVVAVSRITINSNLAALNAQRRLGQSTRSLRESFERLSSGLRINRAKDDAAGLSISAGLNVDKRVYAQGVRNLNDGISLLNVAEGALSELTSIVIRLRELATQSANGTLGVKQRKALDAEAQELSKEYTRVARSTEFNELALFDGEFEELSLQGGYGEQGAISSGLGGAIGDGSFDAAQSFSSGGGTFPEEVAIGDFNGDGIADLVTANYQFAGSVSVLLGNGDGSFQQAAQYTAGAFPDYVAVGDFDGDGKQAALSDIRLQPTRPKRSGVGPVVEFFVAIAGRR